MSGSAITPGAGAALVALLEGRAGQITVLRLADGSERRVWNVAWGRDLGDAWEHIITNASPFVEGAPIDLLDTEDVIEARDNVTGEVLYALS